ncbi:pacearchaeosortase [Candidatus Woesearchaeota archaeon]|nr:hypothetical protein [uncultured archaeon]MBS3167275.1 pacearchaeosortase [Candidatus Woesearchaeota archaeon]
MNYYQKLILRMVALVIFSYSLFSYIITPITKYVFYFILRIFYNQSLLTGNQIIIENNFLTFNNACAAVSAYYLIFILVILTKDISLKNIIKMLSFGFGAIFVANLLRLTFLISILEINEKFFDFWHLLIWKVIATLFVALVWILLIKRYKVNNTPIYSDLKYLIQNIKLFK